MKVIIPLGSKDENFRTEFRSIKSLTKLGDSTIIEVFLKNLPFTNEYIFLCTQDDLVNTKLLSILQGLKIKKKIVPIMSNTSSVIETVYYAENYMKDNESVLICHPDSVNDFGSIKEMKEKLQNQSHSGCLFVFHEDCQTNTAELKTGRILIKKNKVIKINEKSLKTDNSLTLTGIYFFKRWIEFKKYSNLTLKNQLPIQGRYFISQVFNEYIRERKKLSIIKIKKHISFGLISHVNEYNFWFNYFNKNIKRKLRKHFNFLNLIPSCGDGLRFKLKKNENFKPLVKVNEDFMIIKTLKSLPKSKKNVVVMRNDHNKKYSFKSKITKKFPRLETLILNKKTDGMASTCFQYLKNTELKTPLIISSCDYAVIFDEEKFSNLLKFYDPEVVVWTFKKYPDARISPNAYAYCKIKNGKILKISEKTPISNNPHLDHIVQGIFYFKNKEIFFEAYRKMIENKAKINNEYYVGNSINELISKKYKVLPFEVEQYICLGTLQDLKVYNFWSQHFYD